MRKQDLVEHAIMEMISALDFDGYLLMRFDVKVVDQLAGTDLQTAGLVYQNGRFFIRIAYDFFKELSDEERIAVLKHEVAHFVNKHFARRNGRDPRIWNIAADCAINQEIRDLPENCVKLPNGWESNQATEFYYDKYIEQMKKEQKQKGGQGKDKGQGQRQGQGQGQKDQNQQGGQNHSGLPEQWDTVMDSPFEGNSAESMADEIIRETVKQRLNEGADPNKLRGLHAGAMADIIDSLTKPPMLDWRHTLNRFAASLADAVGRLTLKRPDRRQLSPFGKRKEYLPSLVVCVDTSGSVSQELLNKFFSQIALLGRMLTEIEVVIADAQVHEHFKYHRGLERKLAQSGFGRGGTDFDPAVRYINKNLSHCDGVVYLTDGYCPVPDTKCKLPMIWIVAGNQSFEGNPKVNVNE